MYYKYTKPDNGNIDIHENYDVEFWARQLGISPAALREIVMTTGTSVKAVKKYLGR